MIRKYLVSAFRALWKQKFYTFINVAGLSVGVGACLVMILFVTNEIGYDRSIPDSDRVYRLNTEIKFGDNHFKIATGYPSMAELFRQNYPEVEEIVRFKDWGSRFVRKEDQEEKTRENAIWTDSTFFKVFPLTVLQGDPRTALQQPHSIAISERMANKYFPEGNAIGQNLIIDDDDVSKITAVYKDIPSNTHFHFDILRSTVGFKEAESVTLIGGSDFHVYIKLRPGADPKALEQKFPGFIETYVMPQVVDAVGGDPSLEAFNRAGNIWEYTLTPIQDIHLHSALLGEFEANGNITYVYLFSAIALFILLIACINFMNLSTARSAGRAKEVGVRKVLGSQRRQLMTQFLLESFVLTALSILLSLMLAWFVLPAFNELSGKSLTMPFGEPGFYLILLLAVTAVTLLAGLYPAFFLSAFRPALVLKSSLSRGMKSGRLRSVLVVFQFVISITLIIATIAINKQLGFIQGRRLGFDKDQVISVKNTYQLGKNAEVFKQEVLQNAMITSGTISGFVPVEDGYRSGDTFWKGEAAPTTTEIEKLVNMQTWYVDVDYIKTFQMHIKEGRGFSKEFPSDSDAVILNETALRRFQIEGDPIGAKISHFSGVTPDGKPDPTKTHSVTVIGVVEDFHFQSLHDNIGPLGFFLGDSRGRIIFRFDPAHTADVVDLLRSEWNKFSTGVPFNYSFLDDDFAKMYQTEQKLGQIFTIFAGLAILIACLGLFALTAFTAEQRTREIGIRKALGDSVTSILVLLSRDFGRLILWAFFIAIPLAWFATDWWLGGYAYRTSVGISVFVLAGATTAIIAILTMTYQSMKAARSNPVESLRSE